MKVVLLYGSTHGKTRKVVEDVIRGCLTPDVFNVSQPPDGQVLRDADVLLIFCPTYGDEELQDDMDQFLGRFEMDLSGKLFAICELGNYYGYDNFSFGAMAIVRRQLLSEREGTMFVLSLDSLPRLPWTHLHDWVKQLNRKLHEYV